jgi:membrane protease YdiL (CAAX protease family)
MHRKMQITNREIIAPFWHTILLISWILVPLSLLPGSANIVQAARGLQLTHRYLLEACSHLGLMAFAYFGVLVRRRKIETLTNLNSAPLRLRFNDGTVVIVFWLFIVSISLLIRYSLGSFSTEKISLLPVTPTQLAAYIPLAIIGGASEEVVFRGYVFRQVRAISGNLWTALFGQAMLFSIAHGYHQTFAGFFHKCLVGLAFGLFAAWRGNLVPVIAAHVLLDVSAGIVSVLSSLSP